jgi:ATP-binding cassette subfamily B protein
MMDHPSAFFAGDHRHCDNEWAAVEAAVDSGNNEEAAACWKRYDAAMRRHFAMVLQDTWLFNGTIADNIRYSREDASDDEVIAAARAARVDHFVRTLPEGYHLVLNEETTNISQGQKQLLTIARAILADPEMLILDEATSSVDTRTEVLIQEAMDTLMQGRTSFIIAHRLSTIRNADLILVMDEGDIVEQGTHEELLAKGGFYAELYNSQFEVTA